MGEIAATVLTIARDIAFFSFVCPQVLETQPSMTLLHAYTPVAKVHMAKYLAPVFIVAQAKTKPKIATALAIVICLASQDQEGNRVDDLPSPFIHPS